MKKSVSEHIKDFKNVHGDKYDYSKVQYKNTMTKIEIICPEHGSFFQKPNTHKQGHGCKKYQYKKLRNPLEKIIKELELIYGDKYNYSKINYKNSRSSIIIGCPIHDDFRTTFDYFRLGYGCPICNTSKGEIKIAKFLKNNTLNFLSEYTFKNCKKNGILRFDFYLPDHNILIEFDGEQHYKPIKFFGGEKEFKKLQERDKIKTEYCKKNNIKLIRIPYTEFNNIEKILKEEI